MRPPNIRSLKAALYRALLIVPWDELTAVEADILFLLSEDTEVQHILEEAK